MVRRCAPKLTSSAPLQLTLRVLIEACLQPRRAMGPALLPCTTRNEASVELLKLGCCHRKLLNALLAILLLVISNAVHFPLFLPLQLLTGVCISCSPLFYAKVAKGHVWRARVINGFAGLRFISHSLQRSTTKPP